MTLDETEIQNFACSLYFSKQNQAYVTNFSMPVFRFRTILPVIAWVYMLMSCQKESGDSNNNNNQKPKLGTTWIYRFHTYYSNGGLATSGTITYKAKSEETINGEKWLKITDVAADTTVYLLKEKTDGLYQYTNNNAYLFCKNPAVLNETYTTYNRGFVEDFKVLGINENLPTDIGDVVVNYYEGSKEGNLIDQIWYNTNAWIVRHQVYRKFPMGTDYYKQSALFLQEITY